MKNKPRIALDVDGVLSNFYLTICQKFDKPYGKLKQWNTPWIEDVFHEIENDYDFWNNMLILNQPDKITFDFDCYLSSFPEPMFDARLDWLYKNNYPLNPLFQADDKLKWCKILEINILIDDKPETVKQINEANIDNLKAILYMPPYAEYENIDKIVPKNTQIIRNLSEINKII